MVSQPGIDQPESAAKPIIRTFTGSSDAADAPTFDLVFDPFYPAPELRVPGGSAFGATFGIPFTSLVGRTLVRAASVVEYADMFGIVSPSPTLQDSELRWILLCGVLLATLGAFLGSYRSMYHRNHCMHRSPRHSSASELLCLIAQPLPTKDDWTRGYYHDKDTRAIITRLVDADLKGRRWEKKELEQLNPAYCQPLRDGLIVFIRNRLCYIQPMQTHRQAISLIILPVSMRHKLFEAYHATAVAGHMSIYKTLHRLRLRFCWPKMRQLVTN